MTNFEATTYPCSNMSLMDRGIRVGLGLAVLFGTLHFSISGGDAYSLTMLFMTIVVLTGIAGWDPLYAVFRGVMSRMTNMEVMTFSKGNISMQDRALRIGLGLAVLIASLQGPIGSMEFYMSIKMVATIAVLTGIAGWDPLYAVFRKVVMRLHSIEPYRRQDNFHYS